MVNKNKASHEEMPETNRHSNKTESNQTELIQKKLAEKTLNQATKEKSTITKDKKKNKTSKKKLEEKAELKKYAPNTSKEISIHRTTCIEELSTLLLTPKNEIIKSLLLKGISVTPNQLINEDIIQQIADEYETKIITEPKPIITTKTSKPISTSAQTQRPPIVTIIGHVNHGKTTLLHKIRNSQTNQKEAGGITQKIGAYETIFEHKGENRKIVFLDTPGHETFSSTRSKSLSNSDLAILVIAIDDGIKAQTIESIKQAKDANIPIVVAINKVDKTDSIKANTERLKTQLAEYNLIPEEWGGDTSMVAVSASQEYGIKELIDNIFLRTDMLDLRANPTCEAKGIVLETNINKTKGITTLILVQEGTLHIGETIVIGDTWSKIKNMVDASGKTTLVATASSVITIQGLLTTPHTETHFSCFRKVKDAIEFIKMKKTNTDFPKTPLVSATHSFIKQENKTEINVIIKAESQGLLEAVALNIPTQKHPNVNVRITKASVGYVTETDVEFAITSKSEILAFNTTYAPEAKKLANKKNIIIKDFKVIYDILNYISALENGNKSRNEKTDPTGIGIVKAIFPTSKTFVAGVLVTKGTITKKSLIHIIQELKTIYTGEIKSLKRGKEDISEAHYGSECGICLPNFAAWKIGDFIHAFDHPL
ncbi:translation initiation factor 2 (plastid) [Cryptomonas paramecium]|uniref:Translation initiation factor IF-2, chloroplastic n=1 Tax=Cryptomonas paramaecium TaxID=2898 RepID=D2IS84_9CRYP|nr:translation initiation factor 2 [Cryptomonas paramecium]ACT46776.1 translation initiation factor 2 [Cryptomonas paramecium]BDA98019.1 translation initiation factor 2 [Cryptomonas paramecium]